MANFEFVTSGGGFFRLRDEDSAAIGKALTINTQLISGTRFKPATATHRDALVAYLNSMDYSARVVEVLLQYDDPDEGVYRVRAESRTRNQDELDIWIEEERKAMAKRLELSDPLLITLTITEI